MRVKTTTTIEEKLLRQARESAREQGLEGANAIIERALELYFSGSPGEVWEKELTSGWVKKVFIKGDSILYENIKCRKTLNAFKKEDYTKEALQLRGWKKV